MGWGGVGWGWGGCVSRVRVLVMGCRVSGGSWGPPNAAVIYTPPNKQASLRQPVFTAGPDPAPPPKPESGDPLRDPEGEFDSAQVGRALNERSGLWTSAAVRPGLPPPLVRPWSSTTGRATTGGGSSQLQFVRLVVVSHPLSLVDETIFF